MKEITVPVPFKDKYGRWKIRNLFYETCIPTVRSRLYSGLTEETMEQRANGEFPMFFFGEKDSFITAPNGEKVLYYSLKRIYMGYMHIPGEEYEFAIDVLGGWDHWEAMLKYTVVRRQIDAWRKEYLIKTKCAAGRQIISLSLEGGKDTFQASKYIMAKGWATGDAKERNRTNQQIDNEVAEDMGRVFKMIAGDKK